MGKRGPQKGVRYRPTRRKAGAIAALLKRKELADERWAEEVLRLALQDNRIFYDDKGNFIPVKDWTDEHGRLVAGMEVIIKNAEAGDGHTDRVLKLKHWDKLRALELWGKYRSLLVDKTEVNLTAGETMLALLDQAKARNRGKADG